MQNEFININDKLYDVVNKNIRDANTQQLAQQMVANGDPIKETQKANNRLLVLNGEYGGFKLTGEETLIQGMPGTTITGLVTVESGRTTLNNLYFFAKPASTATTAMLIIKSGVIVSLVGCNFECSPGQTGTYINVEAGGKLLLTGCTFLGDASKKSFVISNAGIVTDTILIGTINVTGKLHNNVTTIAEILP